MPHFGASVDMVTRRTHREVTACAWLIGPDLRKVDAIRHHTTDWPAICIDQAVTFLLEPVSQWKPTHDLLRDPP
jgi:hypothetical protein